MRSAMPTYIPAAMQTKSTANIAAWSASGSFETPARDFSTVKTPSVLPCLFATIVGDQSEPISRSWRGVPQGQARPHLAKENSSAIQERESKRGFALGCKFLAHGIRHLRHKQRSRGIHRCCLARCYSISFFLSHRSAAPARGLGPTLGPPVAAQECAQSCGCTAHRRGEELPEQARQRHAPSP